MKTLLLIGTTLLLIAGCETKEHANAELEGVKHAKEAAARATQHAESGVTEEFDVTECDDYVKKYEQCLDDRVPPDAKPALRSTLEEQKREWRSAAADPEQRGTLPAKCKDATAAAAESMARYGCGF